MADFRDTTCPSTGRACPHPKLCFGICQTRLGEIVAMPDSAIDTLDIPEASEYWFQQARLSTP